MTNALKNASGIDTINEKCKLDETTIQTSGFQSLLMYTGGARFPLQPEGRCGGKNIRVWLCTHPGTPGRDTNLRVRATTAVRGTFAPAICSIKLINDIVIQRWAGTGLKD